MKSLSHSSRQWLMCIFPSSLCIILFTLCHPTSSFTADKNLAQAQQPMKVLVTGAGGQTGRLVLKKLEQDSRYEPKGLVRTEQSAKELFKGDINCPLEHIIVSDITSPTFEEDLPSGIEGLDAMVICTSAVPRISRRSLAAAILRAPWNVIRRKRAIDFRSLQFKWKNDNYPEKVDYEGQMKQINLAKKLGMKHVVLVSSMGVTDPNHFLNNVGKNKDGSGNGDILVWKRKAEQCLVESGLDYSIIHPGGLVDVPGGIQQIELDIDDNFASREMRTWIGREDVANLCVSALTVGRGKKVSFDCIATDLPKKSLIPKNVDDTLVDFLQQSKTANYSIA